MLERHRLRDGEHARIRHRQRERCRIQCAGVVVFAVDDVVVGGVSHQRDVLARRGLQAAGRIDDGEFDVCGAAVGAQRDRAAREQRDRASDGRGELAGFIDRDRTSSIGDQRRDGRAVVLDLEGPARAHVQVVRDRVAVGIGHRGTQHQRVGRGGERGGVVVAGGAGVVDRRQLVKRHDSSGRVDADGEVVGLHQASGVAARDRVAQLVEHDLVALRTSGPQRVQARGHVAASEHQRVGRAARTVGAIADGAGKVVGKVGCGVGGKRALVHRECVHRRNATGDDAGHIVHDTDVRLNLRS